jgi:single-stranded-DNA-specific exonuclease
MASCQLANALKISPLLAQCLLNRGIGSSSQAELFLQPRLKNLADPFLLPNMAAAAERLFSARGRQETVVIFGDYDVDGVTATALLFEVMTELGWQMRFFLPHRFEEGYGLTREGVEKCLEQTHASLLLAVDCGSTAIETICWLKQQNVDVIVLDHHQVSNPPPPAVALVNPQASPDLNHRELCSAGLAFKLAHALVKRGREEGLPQAHQIDLRLWLDLVALGTIADIVPLTGENRILVSAGLKQLETTTRPGLQALKSAAQCPSPMGVYEVAFQLAPRLNASGRLEHAVHSLRLLLTRDEEEAVSLASELDSQNRRRQQIERNMAGQIIGDLKNRFDPQTDLVIVEGQLFWHLGVVGIVASRVVREFYRPAIILGGDGPIWRGSGRSIEGFDLAAALRGCDDLLVRHGGHAMAAGLTIESSRLDLFRQRINELARQTLDSDLLRPNLRLDAEVALEDLGCQAVQQFQLLEPFGQANPAVQLCARRLRHASPPKQVGKEKQHLRLRVTDGQTVVNAIWWNSSCRTPDYTSFRLAFVPQIQTFNGHSSVQLKVLDCQPETSDSRSS